MTSALSPMDLREQPTTLLMGYASHVNAVGAAVVEIPFHHRITLSQLHYGSADAWSSGRIFSFR
jgi:hypothetical protein